MEQGVLILNELNFICGLVLCGFYREKKKMNQGALLDKTGHVNDAGWACLQVWDAEGRAVKWMARRMRLNPSSVRYNLVRVTPSQRKTKAAPALTPEHIALIKRRIAAVRAFCLEEVPGPHGPRRKYPGALDITKAWNLAHPDTPTSAATTRRDLKAGGLRSLKRQRGPKRKAGDPVIRLSAARGFLKMGKKKLGNTGFSDAKYFDTNTHGAEREWVLPGQQPSQQVSDTWCPRVHVWGFIHRSFKLLVRIPSHKPTAESYKRMCLIPLVKRLSTLPEGAEAVLQYDGDRAYGAKDILSYLDKKGIKHLKGWPARSPDLSPIENMWAIVQKRVDAFGPSDADELWNFVKRAWDEVDMKIVRNLCASFPGRLRKCIRADGETIVTSTKRN